MRQPRGDWTDLFLAFRLLLDPRKLWLALKGVGFSIVLVGLLLALFAALHSAVGVPFGSEPLAAPSIAQMPGHGRGEPADEDLLDALWRGSPRGALRATRAFAAGLVAKAGSELARVVGGAGRRPLDRLLALWTSEALVTLAALGLLAAFVLLFIWSYYGAAIARLAAVEYALGDRIALSSATAYTRRKHQAFYGPPLGLAIAVAALSLLVTVAGLLVWNVLLLAIAAIGLLAVAACAGLVRDRTRSTALSLAAAGIGLAALAAVLGLIAWAGWRIPYAGEIALGIVSPLALLAGIAMALLAVWLVFGLPIMVGVVATANVGAFEAWSRSFHYLFMHPWRCALHCLVGLVHGAACLGFVYLVRCGAEWAAFVPLSAGAILLGAEVSEPLLSLILALDRVVLDVVFLTFVAGYAFTSATISYFLLRRCADGTPISEVYLEPRDRERVVPTTAPPGGGEPESPPAGEPEA